MKIEMEVCDVCRRPPDGNRPDCLYFPCGKHAICDECTVRSVRHGGGRCPICNPPREERRQ